MSKFSTHGYTFISVGDAGKVFSSCAHCGLGIRYYASFKNDATGEIIHIGQTCFSNATPAQKQEFDAIKKAAAFDRKIEKLIATNSVVSRLMDYCATHEEDADKSSSNCMLFLKKRHFMGAGSLNANEITLVDLHLTKVGA